jgi:hypothetical protein
MGADIGMDALAHRPPIVDRSLETVALGAADAAIVRHPAHHLGKHVVLGRTAPFPDAAVGLSADLAEMFEQFAFELPGAAAELDIGAPRLMEGIHQFAENIELELPMGGIAEAHRL